MFSFVFRRLALGAAPLVLAACGSTAVVLEQPAPTPPSGKTYSAGYVRSVTTTILDDDNPDERRLADKQSLERRLPSAVRKGFEEHGIAMTSESSGQTAATVAVTVDVKYDPGNRSLRWLAGPFGAGKGSMDVRMKPQMPPLVRWSPRARTAIPCVREPLVATSTKMSRTWSKTWPVIWPKTSQARAGKPPAPPHPPGTSCSP
jgi:hypothetical protein